jgi:hypothetical protein
MSRHYEKSKPLSATLLSAGRYLFGGLAAVLFLLAVLFVVGQILRPDQDSIFVLAISAIPLFILGLMCVAAYKSASRGSSNFYWLAAGTAGFAVLAVSVIGWLFTGFTPG